MSLRILAVALLLCGTAAAQETDIFDPTDFVDPRERGAVFSRERWGFGITDPGRTFSIIRLYGGTVDDYQWRSVSSDADLSFLHATWSTYWSDKQFNLKTTFFDRRTDVPLPTWRATAQFGQYYGQYFRLPKNGDEAAEEQRIATRLLLTWSVEDNPYLGSNTAPPQDGSGFSSPRNERFNHEFGIQTDVRLPLPKRRAIDGSFIWMRRRVDAGHYIDRLSYLYRVNERLRSNGRLHLNAALGAGAEHTQAWHCCLARAVLTATFVIPWLDTGLNVAYAPTFSPSSEGRRTHHEVAFYLDRTVLAKLADVRK